MAVGQCDFPTMHDVAGITLGTACAGTVSYTHLTLPTIYSV